MNSRTIQVLSAVLFGLLVLWGGYTFIYYLGVPYHTAALTTEAIHKDITAMCDTTAFFCRGLSTIEPFFMHTIERAAPFLWYLIGSVLLLAIVAVWQFLSAGRMTIRIVWSPWKLLLLFIASVWLFSTVISFGTVSGRPETAYLEPTKDTYNVTDEALGTLQKDYQSLLERGCLSEVGAAQNGAKVYTMNAFCIEEAFFQRTLPQIFFIVILLAEFLIAGRMALWWMGYRTKSLMLETVLSVGMGASVITAILWCGALIGVYVSTFGWLLAVAIPVACFPHTRYWIDKFLNHRWAREYRWYDMGLILGWLLVSYLALNFLEVVRPFPIGWDDLGSYLNRPRLLVSYGSFISSMSPFDWTYLTSLGFLLFGFNSTFGATASMMINWSGGLLAVVSIFVFARAFLGNRSGILSALIYYTLPLVGHFSFADMKIDNPVFFYGAAGMLAAMLAVFPQTAAHLEPGQEGDMTAPEGPGLLENDKIRLLVVAGIFCGMAFATKVTAVMVILPLGALLVGILLDWTGFLGAVSLSFAVFSYQGAFSLEQIMTRVTGSPASGALNMACTLFFVVVGLLLLGACVMRKQAQTFAAAKLLAAFGLGLMIAILPWVEHNTIEAGWIFPRLALSAPNRISPVISYDKLEGDLKIDLKNPMCQSTGSTEELDRYWGFSGGIGHYLTLPWRTVMNLDSTGYYVTTIPGLLLFPLLLLLPYFWTARGRWLRWLFGATVMMVLEWMFLANGIPWYGVGILLGLVVGLEALVEKAPDLPNRIIISVLLVCSLFVSFGLRFWQYEQQANIFEYSMGKVSADALREITIPYYDAISATAVDRHTSVPGQPYLYRVGTFISYFIPKNLEIIGINDHQLDVFNCLYSERNPALTVRRLKALGFNSIVFDTNTATIERDEQGSLHKKVDAFVEFVNNPAAGLKVLISDTNAGLAFILIP